MRGVIGRLVLGALLVLACWGAVASAATPSPGLVTVRIEGASSTLLPATTVATQAAAFHPANDPNTSHTCAGTSVARALEMATGGIWTGTYSATSQDYTVTSILEESHPSSGTDGSSWTFRINDTPVAGGICRQSLDPGDQVVFFPTCTGAACPSGSVSPALLGLSASAVVQSGTAFTASVVSYPNGGGTPTPVLGATVTGDGVSATTGAGGQATLTLTTPGSYLLSATAANAVRTESLICVHNGNDGNCGTPDIPVPTTSTTIATTPPVPCATNGHDGLCGTIDSTAPIARLQIPEGRHYSHGRGPRQLVGSVGADPSGIRVIKLRLSRQYQGRCETWSASKDRLVGAKCGITNAAWFTVGSKSPFTYLLGKPLPIGRYVLDVKAVDGAGNVEAAPVPGRSEIVFRVG